MNLRTSSSSQKSHESESEFDACIHSQTTYVDIGFQVIGGSIIIFVGNLGAGLSGGCVGILVQGGYVLGILFSDAEIIE
ncbi:hypothetical protein [Chitinophaga sp.]|uniref:hypothetical protein n=1 Tax=Chitinophaga sp. TaxID=1869181 RepID=UPI0039C8ABF8